MVTGAEFAGKNHIGTLEQELYWVERAKNGWFALGGSTKSSLACGDYSQAENLFWKVLDENSLWPDD